MNQSKNYQKALLICEENKEFLILDYIRGKSPKVKLKCHKCGYEFERYLCHFIQYPHVCPKCCPKGKRQTISLDQAQKRIDEIYGENYLKILEYKGNNTKTQIQCLHCGLIFESVPSSVWRGRIKGCPSCEKTRSLGEARLERFFREHHIQYQTQKRFLDCKDELMLPFDFFLPQYNTCVEFQGEQHYNSKSLLYSEKLLYHDSLKREYCNLNGISLIEIPYFDINKIENYFTFIRE